MALTVKRAKGKVASRGRRHLRVRKKLSGSPARRASRRSSSTAAETSPPAASPPSPTAPVRVGWRCEHADHLPSTREEERLMPGPQRRGTGAGAGGNDRRDRQG